jgi:hypothetical protein
MRAHEPSFFFQRDGGKRKTGTVLETLELRGEERGPKERGVHMPQD